MKSRLLLTGLGALLALSGCSEPATEVACDAPATIKLVKESVNSALLMQTGADDSVEFAYELTAVNTQETNTETGALVCSADLAVTIKDENLNDTLNTAINYSVELNEADKTLYVKVFENTQ